MTINEAVTAIQDVLEAMSVVVSAQVRPSGDDVDVIKIWVDLGSAALDPVAWAKACERDLVTQVPGAAAFRLQVRAERDA